MIAFNEVTLSYPGAQAPALKDVSLDVPPGQVVLVCGASGCGKTSLTRVLNGLAVHFDEADVRGSVRVNGHDVLADPLYKTGRTVGSVFQNPRSQFFCIDTTSEIAFGCENMGIPVKEVNERVRQAAFAMDVDALLERDIFKLSGGQKQKIACASVAAMQPDVFVLDEPSSNLDEVAMGQLRGVIELWKSEGKTVILAEHRFRWIIDICDRVLVMKAGRLVADIAAEKFASKPPAWFKEQGLRPMNLDGIASFRKQAHDAEDTTILNNFSFAYEREGKVLDVVRVEVPTHGAIAVIGRNGAGKSTFSHCLCGLKKPFKGTVTRRGETLNRRDLLQRCYMVMQDVNYQLFCESVDEEVRLGMDPSKETEVASVMESLDLGGLAEKHPLALSGGQKQRVAIAVALLAGRDVLVFDEPTSGLDLKNMEACARLISRIAERATVFIVTHDPEFILSCCTHVMHLEDGNVVANRPLDEQGIQYISKYFNEEVKGVGR